MSFASWLDLFAEADHVGSFEWEVVPDRIRWNRGAEGRKSTTSDAFGSFARLRRFLHPEDSVRITQELAALIGVKDSHFQFQFRFRMPRRQERFIAGTARCIYDIEGRPHRLFGFVVDVTARERDKHFLALGEAQMRAVMETVPDAMIVIDEKGIIQSFNTAAERMFGWSEVDVVGRNIEILMPARFSVTHAAAITSYLGGAQPQVIGRTRLLTATRADGSEFPIELNVGEAVVGKTHLFTGFVRDVSERFEAAERLDRLREQFLRNARLNAMGEVAAVLAHDLNQSLSAAANFLAAVEIEAGREPGNDGLSGNAQRAQSQLARVGEMIRRLRTFVSNGDRSPENFSVDQVIDEALALALPGLRQDRTGVFVSLEPADLLAFADRIQIQQVMVNLLRNAIDATAPLPVGQRRIHIEARHHGDRIEVNIRDNGPGFQPHVLDVLEPHFTTKGSGGMGLGLSICRRIVDEQGGKLILTNDEGGGAHVSFTLPRGFAYT